MEEIKVKKKIAMGILTVAAAITLSACGNEEKKVNQSTSKNHSNMMDMENSSSEENMPMNHSSSGEIPKGLKEAKDPTYPFDSKAVLHTNHMEGMNGAKATIVGAYDTTAYAVSYKSTTNGEVVKNHKWVIQEEIRGNHGNTIKNGSEVTIEADHMEGMNGAAATIDSSEKTTVYMVDYTPTTGGDLVKNHKWVVEDELSNLK